MLQSNLGVFLSSSFYLIVFFSFSPNALLVQITATGFEKSYKYVIEQSLYNTKCTFYFPILLPVDNGTFEQEKIIRYNKDYKRKIASPNKFYSRAINHFFFF